jgi:hypothetical protein
LKQTDECEFFECTSQPTARFLGEDVSVTGSETWENNSEDKDLSIDTPTGESIQQGTGLCGPYAKFTGDTTAYTNFDLMGLFSQDYPPGRNNWIGKYNKNFAVSMIFEITGHPDGEINESSAATYYQSLLWRQGLQEYAYRIFYDRRTRNITMGASRRTCCYRDKYGEPKSFTQHEEVKTPTDSIELGVRYHLVVVFCVGYFRLYFDGEFMGQYTLGREWAEEQSPYGYRTTGTYIGSVMPGRPHYGGPLIGKIYEFELFSPTTYDPLSLSLPMGFPWFEPFEVTVTTQSEFNALVLRNNVGSGWDDQVPMGEKMKEYYEEKQCVIPLQTPLCVRGITGPRSIYNQTYDYLDFATSTNRHRWRSRETLPSGISMDIFYSGSRSRWEIGSFVSPGFEPATGNEMNPWSTTWSEGVSVTRGECPIVEYMGWLSRCRNTTTNTSKSTDTDFPLSGVDYIDAIRFKYGGKSSACVHFLTKYLGIKDVNGDLIDLSDYTLTDPLGYETVQNGFCNTIPKRYSADSCEKMLGFFELPLQGDPGNILTNDGVDWGIGCTHGGGWYDLYFNKPIQVTNATEVYWNYSMNEGGGSRCIQFRQVSIRTRTD